MAKKKLVPTYEISGASVHIYRNYDLRTPMDVKLADVHKHTRLTIFLNRRHNLAHVFYKGEEDAYLRIRLPYQTLRNTHDEFCRKWLANRLKNF